MNFSAGSVLQLPPRVAHGHHAVDHRRPRRREQHEAHDDAERLHPLGYRVVVQVMRARPDVAVDERPERDDREAIAPDRLLGLLRQEVVEHAEESAGQQEADGVVAVPPLHDGVLRAGKQRVRLAERRGQREVVHDVQHRDDDDQRAVEPVRDVDRCDLAASDRAEEHDRVARSRSRRSRCRTATRAPRIPCRRSSPRAATMRRARSWPAMRRTRTRRAAARTARTCEVRCTL